MLSRAPDSLAVSTSCLAALVRLELVPKIMAYELVANLIGRIICRKGCGFGQEPHPLLLLPINRCAIIGVIAFGVTPVMADLVGHRFFVQFNA